MPAPVRIEVEAWTDPRFVVLAQLIEVSKWDARGRVAFLWAHATRKAVGVSKRDLKRDLGVLREIEIDAIVELKGFARALVESDLASVVEGGVRLRGTNMKRTGWLNERLKAASRGGFSKASKVGSKPVANAKQDVSKHLASGSGSGSSSGSGSGSGSSSETPEENTASPSAPAARRPRRVVENTSLFSTVPSPDPPTTDPLTGGRKAPSGGSTDANHQPFVTYWHARYKQRAGTGYGWSETREFTHVAKILRLAGAPGESATLAEAKRRVDVLFDAPPSFLGRSLPDLKTLCEHWNKLAAPAQNGGGPAQGMTPQEVWDMSETMRLAEEAKGDGAK